MALNTQDDVRSSAIRNGKRAFGHAWVPVQWSVAPGRLELLGNHVDYNGGLVLAGAIDRSIWIAIAIAEGGQPDLIQAIAGDVEDRVITLRAESVTNDIDSRSGTGPEQYLQGVIEAMIARDLKIRSSLQLSIAGDVPLGFGMSSSAGLCVAMVIALSTERLQDQEIILIAQDAEHRAGSPVGAMDQSASVAGGVILFDGATITFKRLEPVLHDYVFAVANSGVNHAIGSSSYPRRVEESRRALALIQEHLDPGLQALGALEPDAWSGKKRRQVPGLDRILVSRVDHVVSEVERVRQGVAAIETSDWRTFGRLMSASGRSSAEQYEISHPLVEELVSDLRDMPGVAGARMMGGGEGGPALALIESRAVEKVRSTLADGYYSRHADRSASDALQVCGFGPGARLIRA